MNIFAPEYIVLVFALSFFIYSLLRKDSHKKEE